MTVILLLVVTSNVVIASDDVLQVVKSSAVTWLDVKSSHFSARHRRDLYDATLQNSIVDIHNLLRRQEGASNMQLMTWNDYLAGMADEWAQNCNFAHGQPYRDPNSAPYNPVGQNLYAISGANLNVTRAVIEWYNEKPDYNYDTLHCPSGKMCGHYTQVVWSSSRQVGCGFKFCPTLSSSNLRSAFYFVCNYGPAGNYQGEKPFKKGYKCSQCSSGIGWCTDGLCNSDCKGAGPGCQCGAICYNCATLKSDSCTCQCVDGWYGNDCSVVCEDTDSKCNANPGWPPQWCNSPQYGDYVRAGCPAMCGLCKKVQNVRPGQCAAVGGLGTAASPIKGHHVASAVLFSVVAFIFTRCHFIDCYRY